MDVSEEEKIREMMNQSTADYNSDNFMPLRGQGQSGPVRNTYRCNKCNQGGHWIKDCPLSIKVLPWEAEHFFLQLISPVNKLNSYEQGEAGIRKSTGIPRIFMVNVDGPQVPGALLTPEGRYAVPAVDQ